MSPGTLRHVDVLNLVGRPAGHNFIARLMTPLRITASLLSLLLLALLVWAIARGVGDLRTQIMLGVGVVLGVVYVAYGRLPDWAISLSGRYVVADDDPSNISARVYWPIISAVILLAIVTFVVVVFVL